MVFRATARRARYIIAVTWIISLVIMLPDIIGLDTHLKFAPELTYLLTTCKPTWQYYHQVEYATLSLTFLVNFMHTA